MKHAYTTPLTQAGFAVLRQLEKFVLPTLDGIEGIHKIVERMLVELGSLHTGYQAITLALIDEETQMLQRIAASHTEEAKAVLVPCSTSAPPIALPLSETTNPYIQAIQSRLPQLMPHGTDVFLPAHTRDALDRKQDAQGIHATLIYPLLITEKPVGVLIFSVTKDAQHISQEEKDLLAGLTDSVGVAVHTACLSKALAQATEQLTQANQQLLVAHTKLQAFDLLKDEFLAHTSHELRTPLTAIRGYASLLEKGLAGPLTKPQRRYLRMLRKSSERIMKLASTMHNVSYLQEQRFAIDPQPLDLISLAQAALSEVLPTAKTKHVTATIQFPASPLPLVLADSKKIKDVLQTLLGNALTWTPAGGQITIAFQEYNGMVTTCVQDTGKGIRQEDMQCLFHEGGMMKKNHLVRQGNQETGLGLYLSRSLIRIHGGELTLTSAGENKGTTVSFSLHAAQPYPDGTQSAPKTHPPSPIHRSETSRSSAGLSH